MAKKPEDLRELSESEWEVMKAVWIHGPMAARDIYARVKEKHDWTYETVRAFLKRIVRKGWLDFDQVGTCYLYRPAIPHEKAVKGAIRSFVDRVLDGGLSPFVAYLAEHGDLSPEELDQLGEIVKRRREKERRGKP
jgi:predicted transcriptional regulator